MKKVACFVVIMFNNTAVHLQFQWKSETQTDINNVKDCFKFYPKSLTF